MKTKTLFGLLTLTGSLFMTPSCQQKEEMPFRNPDLAINQRIDDLLNRLTPEEKVQQMMNQTPAIKRLGIPAYDWWNEALHGVARAGKATVFPQAIALAATFDEPELYKTFTLISDEARAKYNHYQEIGETDRYKGLTFWTPNINIFRDPRWGRGMETYGEDPYLTSMMGMAVVKGLQGDDPHYLKTHACAKHYAVHSGPEWNRHSFDAEVSPRDLWTTYLPAFKALVTKANVQEVMCAYNSFEGQPCCSSDKLLIEILRKDWQYNRIILSDCGAINDFYVKSTTTPRHETHADALSASKDAVLSGTDLECGNSYRSLIEGLKNGKITEKDLEPSLRRLFKGRFELGMFDPKERVPYSKIPYEVVESPEHIAQALKMAHESIVLLENKGQTLPLSKTIKTIAVVGPNAADSTMLWANYNGFPTHTTTILEGIQKSVPQANVIYLEGCNHTATTLKEDLGASITYKNKKGFGCTYYNNKAFKGTPVYKGIAEQLRFTTGGNTQFAPNVNLKDFSAQFEGTFTSPVDGPVTLKVEGNDGLRLFVDKQKVAEHWDKDYNRSKSYTLNAKKGKSYLIHIDYFQKIGNATLNFFITHNVPVDYAGVAKQAAQADVIVFVGGLSPRLEGEQMSVHAKGFKGGDRTNIQLPDVQKNMLKSLKATHKPLVCVMCSGSALALNWEKKNADALINAWYGGQEAGTAVADVLFGDYNPSGRLPITYYTSIDQLSDFQNYNMTGRTYRYMTQKPLYPFGYGLSYTTFKFKKATLSKTTLSPGESVDLKVTISNTGKHDGDEVIQVYIKNPNDPKGPIKALKAFKRIPIKAGEQKEVTLAIASEAFNSFNDERQTMEIRTGKYEVLYGSSSADKDLHSLTLTIK